MELAFDGRWPIPLVASLQNKAKFPFHQLCLFIDFWTVSSQNPTFWYSNNHFNCRLPSNQRLVGGQPFHLTYNNGSHDSGWKNKDGVSQKHKIGGLNYSREMKGSEGKKKKETVLSQKLSNNGNEPEMEEGFCTEGKPWSKALREEKHHSRISQTASGTRMKWTRRQWWAQRLKPG